MLDEAEWQEIEPLLVEYMGEIQRYREEHQVFLPDALDAVPATVPLAKYLELTGVSALHVNKIWEHRASLFGPPCKNCHRPLRTPRASFCANCGVAA